MSADTFHDPRATLANPSRNHGACSDVDVVLSERDSDTEVPFQLTSPQLNIPALLPYRSSFAQERTLREHRTEFDAGERQSGTAWINDIATSMISIEDLMDSRSTPLDVEGDLRRRVQYLELRNQQLKLENKALLEKLAVCNEYSKEAALAIDRMEKWIEEKIGNWNRCLSGSRKWLEEKDMDVQAQPKINNEELLVKLRRELKRLKDYSNNLYTEHTVYEQKYEELTQELRISKEKTRKYKNFLKEVLETLKTLDVASTVQRQWK